MGPPEHPVSALYGFGAVALVFVRQNVLVPVVLQVGLASVPRSQAITHSSGNAHAGVVPVHAGQVVQDGQTVQEAAVTPNAGGEQHARVPKKV